MKGLLCSISLILLSLTGFAQYRTYGGQIGTSWSQNEIATSNNPINLIKEYGQFVGVFSRRYYLNGFAQKTMLAFQGFQSNDVNHTNVNRGLSNYTTLVSLSHQVEYTFLNKGPWSTYVLLGANAFTTISKSLAAADENGANESNGSINIALLTGGGIELDLDDGWHIGGEFGYNFTATDDLEGLNQNIDGLNDRFMHFTIELSKNIGGRSLFRIGNGRQECPTF